MKITVNEKSDYAIVIIDGSISLNNLVQLDEKIQSIMKHNKHIIFDFNKVMSIDSSTIGNLVVYSTKLDKILKKCCIAEMNDEINQIFKITKLHKKIDIYHHIEDAIASI